MWNSVWYPHKKHQCWHWQSTKRATKLVISLKKIPCTERLQKLNLPMLTYRRLKGDMIEVFKIVNNMYDASLVPVLSLTLHISLEEIPLSWWISVFIMMLDNTGVFIHRIINIWNSLPFNGIPAPMSTVHTHTYVHIMVSHTVIWERGTSVGPIYVSACCGVGSDHA